MTKLHEPASNSTATLLLNADETAALLPYAALAKEIEGLLHDDGVQVPPRLVRHGTGLEPASGRSSVPVKLG